MIEKVNPSHPDKIADRIAGAIVDLAYRLQDDPKIAVEVLLGHEQGLITIESSINIEDEDINKIIKRLANNTQFSIVKHPQDQFLAENQKGISRCGDNGIFKGEPLTEEEKELSKIAHDLYKTYGSDGKYILDGDKLVICQSHAKTEDLKKIYPQGIINPLGDWTGGTNVDSGATNRKLGSDMGHSVTGGGLHGKDLSKADVSMNIFAFLIAQEIGEPIEISCAIGDETIEGKPYIEIVEIAERFISNIGGFEKFAEWGLF